MGSAKELEGPYTVHPSKRCRCILPAQRTGLDFVSGWGMTDCAKCGGFIKWGVVR